MKFSGHALLFCLLLTASSLAQQSTSAQTPTTKLFLPSASMPADAISSGDLTASGNWIWTHDAGTPGSSIGSSQFPISNPAIDGKAREFHVSYSDHGGERFSLSFAHDATPTHFVYDAHIFVVDPSQLANMEMDLNQVISDGKTVTLAFQCSSYSGSWEYGTIVKGQPHWNPSQVACNPETWTANAWHHVEIGSHRDGDYVTYDWVYLDGVYTPLSNATGLGAQALNWAAGDINLNFQIDGANKYSGSVTLYQDGLTIYRW